MRILILGAGGTGGYFGGRLAEAGADVTFLVRERRAERLATDGLLVESSFGDIRQPVKTLVAPAESEPFDLAILTCKAYDLDDAMQAIAPYLATDGAVLPLLNGVRHVPRLIERFGEARVLGGSCHIAATLTPDGVIKHLNDWHKLTVGELVGERSARVDAIAEVAGKAKLDVQVSEGIEQALWDKLVFLASLAAATCLMRGSVGEIARTRDGKKIVGRLIDECAAVAAAAGHPPADDHLARARRQLTDEASDFTASMLRDLQGGGRIEADHIVGDLVERADAAGVAAPYLKAAYCHLQVYQNRL